MSVAHCEEINRQLRAAGIVVHEHPNWRTRGVSMATAFEGGLVHHTATPVGFSPRSLWEGRSDLAGPLCNYAGNGDGSLTIIAAGVANHAGASGGRSMGPLPVTSSFNKRVLGLEIVYPGTSAMTDDQYRTSTIWGAVVARVVGGGDIERIRAHAETSITGKWDPGYAPGKTIDMTKFRADAARALTQGDQLTPDQDKVLNAISYRLYALTKGLNAVPSGPGIPNGAETVPVSALLAKLAADVAELKARPATPPATGGVDYTLLAKAVCDELDRRSRDGDSKTGPVS